MDMMTSIKPKWMNSCWSCRVSRPVKHSAILLIKSTVRFLPSWVVKGVAIKLPASRVKELIDNQSMKPFEVAEGYVWKEWLSIQRDVSEDYEQDVGLFEESVEFLLS